MEKITLSKRGFTVFKRFVEVKFEGVLNKAKEATEDSDEPHAILHYHGGWCFELDYTCACHGRDDCVEDNNTMAYDEVCDNCHSYPTYINVGLRYRPHYSWTLIECKEFVAKTVKVEMLLEWLDEIESKNGWTFCRYACGNLATMNGACERCYIHSYIRSEEEGGDCCVCRENDGRWIKIRCGHILHYHCFNKIATEDGVGNRKCPMCRQLSSFGHSNIDCYDV